jgi:hypothetical protein
MDPLERYRRMRQVCEEALHQMLAELDPEIAESAVGRTTIAGLLIEKAGELMMEQMEPKAARELLRGLVDRLHGEAHGL